MNDMAQTVTLDGAGWSTIGILGLVLILLVTNRVRLDLIGIFILLALGLSGIVEEKELFSGFGSEAVIVIAAMLAIGEALVQSGVTDRLSSRIAKHSGTSEMRLVLLMMLVAGLASTFISDLAVVSILLPVMLGFEERLGTRPARLLLPVAVASMLGGLISMVGSSSNIVANQVLKEFGHEGLSLFAIAPVGLTLLAAGMLFVWLFGRFFLPSGARESRVKAKALGVREYLSELHIPAGSTWAGRTLRDMSFFRDNGLNVARVLRDGEPVLYPKASTKLRTDDVLLVQAGQEELLKLRSTSDYSVHPQVQKSLEETDLALAGEAIVRQGSQFVGRTLRELGFRQLYDVTVLALSRDGKTITQRIADLPLRTGDMLLLQGPPENMRDLQEEEGLLMVSETPHRPKTRSQGWVAVVILLLALLTAGLGLMPMSVARMIAVGLLVVTRILSMNQVYRAIDWQILVFVAAMIPLGTAMKETGVIALVSQQIVDVFGSYGPLAVLAASFWLAALTTQILSNTATALLLSPVVIGAATQLGVDPTPFVVSVIAAVSASPITYVSHKVFLVIMAPGGYLYMDYVKIGLPMTLLFFALTMLVVPWLWPI